MNDSGRLLTVLFKNERQVLQHGTQQTDATGIELTGMSIGKLDLKPRHLNTAVMQKSSRFANVIIKKAH